MERRRSRLESLYFLDVDRNGDAHLYGVEEVLSSRSTHHQRMMIVRSSLFGKALILDGKWQSATADEFIYHEALVHPALLSHPEPRRVLILGGGEGATLREVLRHRSVAEAVMVDIDREVVEECRRVAGEFAGDAFANPRSRVVYGDGLRFVEDSEPGSWDVIISDLSDPLEGGPSQSLFTREFFSTVEARLAPGGRFVLQAGSTSMPDVEVFAAVVHTLASVFPHTSPYQAYVPSFAMPWGFVLAAREECALLRASEKALDALIAERTGGDLSFLDGAVLGALFVLPKYLRRAVAAAETTYTLASPPAW
jgi:spermidine synthase